MRKNLNRIIPWCTSPGMRKIYVQMKLTFAFILFTVIQTFAVNSYSQITMLSLNVKNSTVGDVLKQIEDQSEFYFLYSSKVIDVNRKVDVQVENNRIDNILKGVFQGTDVLYAIEGRQIVLTTNEITGKNTNVQSLAISGIVKSTTGEALPGVTVTVKGTTVGTITDINGKYTINVPAQGTMLIFSFIGMDRQSIEIGNQSKIDVVMNSSSIDIEEVVAIGYGTAKKSDVTGAMIRVSEEDLRSRPVSNAFEAMQGKAAGVDITSNERPGEVGTILIRGMRSMIKNSNGDYIGNTPLYVVDGIPLMSSSGIETMNPADIESIDILKDASATAIYGSRGANGVILVTTKKGKAGKLTLNYSGTLTLENLQDRKEMMDASEYITWRRWAYYYADPINNPRGDQPTVDKDKVYFLGDRDSYAWNNIMKGWEGGSWNGSKVETTDWAGMVTQTGVTTEHNLSVSGGTEKMKTYASFGYLDNQGTMKGQEYTRYTSKASIDLNPIKWFEMGVSINTTYSLQQYGQSNTGGQVSGPGSIYAAAINNLPYAMPYDADGNRITYPGGDDMIKTMVNEWEYTDNQRKMFRALGSIYAQVNIMPGLKYRMNFGPDFRYYTNGVFIDAMSVNRNGSPNYASLRNESDFSWTLDNLLYFDKKVGSHSFGATLLQTASSWNNNFSYLHALGIPMAIQKWNALNMTNVAALSGWDSGLTERQLMSYMGRFNYGYADKYLITMSGRWDGASQLADTHKWSFFPSAALAWRMDQEGFIKDIDIISQMKLRLGVGTTGNAAIDPYSTKGGVASLFYPYGSTITPGYVPSESLISGGDLPMANHLLGWETTTQYNLGLDFGLLKGRISGVLDVYTSNTTGLLMKQGLPALVGYSHTYSNIGETKNIGFDFTLNTINVQTKDFTWQTNINAAWQKDEIVTLSNGKEDDIANNWFIGESIGVIYGYASNGLWKEEDAAEMAKFNANGHKFQAGMSRPADLNNDYKINANDDRKIIGNTSPRWTVGMTNSFTYKNFDLSFFLYGRLKYMFNTDGEWQGGRYVQRNISYYNENNKNAEYQKPIFNVAGGDPYYNILGYRDASFIKVRNVSLGYTLPKSISNKLGLQTMKIYTQIKNPGMLYSKIDWLDMDLGGSTWNRGFVFGVNVGF